MSMPRRREALRLLPQRGGDQHVAEELGVVHLPPRFDVSDGDINIPLVAKHLDPFLNGLKDPATTTSAPRLDGEKVGGGMCRCGISTTIREVAFNLRHKDFVSDHGAIQAQTKYSVALACHRIHPGLCVLVMLSFIVWP